MSNSSGFWRCKGCGQRGTEWHAVRHSTGCSVAKRMDRAVSDSMALAIASHGIRYFAPKGRRETLS